MGQPDEEGAVDQNLIRALAHPLRVKILQILGEETSSPAQLSALLEEPIGSVAYHTRVLAARDCIELVEARPVRGVVAHFYKAKPHVALQTQSWRKAPPALRSDVVSSSLHEFTARALETVQARTPEEGDGSTLTSLALTVDEQGLREIGEILRSLEGKLQAVGESCSIRLQDSDEGISIVVAVAAFEADGKRRGESA